MVSDCTHCNILVIRRERAPTLHLKQGRVLHYSFVLCKAAGFGVHLVPESSPVTEGKGALPAPFFTKQLRLGKCSSLCDQGLLKNHWVGQVGIQH